MLQIHSERKTAAIDARCNLAKIRDLTGRWRWWATFSNTGRTRDFDIIRTELVLDVDSVQALRGHSLTIAATDHFSGVRIDLGLADLQGIFV